MFYPKREALVLRELGSTGRFVSTLAYMSMGIRGEGSAGNEEDVSSTRDLRRSK